MYYRCVLLIRGVAYDATGDLKNWDDVKTTVKRGDYGGAVRSFSSSFVFVGDAYARLMDEYRSHMLDFTAGVVFYTRTNSWEWREEFNRRLDVGTLHYTAHEISLNAVDDSVEAIIKAGRGTQYEYSVENYKEEWPLRYDGILLENSVTWELAGDSDEEGNMVLDIPAAPGPSYVGNMKPSLFVTGEDVAYNKSLSYSDYGDDQEFLATAIQEGSAAAVSYFYDVDIQSMSSSGFSVVLMMGTAATGFSCDSAGRHHGGSSRSFTIDSRTGVRVLVRCGKQDERVVFRKFKFGLRWHDRNRVNYIDVVKPVVLLNCLLKSMNGGKDGLSGRIDWLDARGDGTLMLPAESARGLGNAKMYSSFAQFCEWMSAVFGFVYYVDGNTVNFVHRDKLFEKGTVKKIANLNGFKYRVNASLIYSRVNVGYDKQDYDSVNGRYEFNFTTYYTTGTTVKDGKLELKSPYRADCYGIEFLVDKRGADTTDTDSDSDMFFVGVKGVQDGYYVLDRESAPISGAPAGTFNGMYAPMACVRANGAYIASSAGKLHYASSDGYSEVEIGGTAQDADIELGGGLFTVGEIEVETDDLAVPGNWNGVVEVEQDGIVYKGFISSVDISYTRLESATYKLIESGVDG